MEATYPEWFFRFWFLGVQFLRFWFLRVQLLKVRFLKNWAILTGDSVDNFAAGPFDEFTILLSINIMFHDCAILRTEYNSLMFLGVF